MQPTKAKVIVPTTAYAVLQNLARSKRLAFTPGDMLEHLLKSSGIYVAGLIPTAASETVKTLHLNLHCFECLQYVQKALNSSIWNLTLMDIVVANLVLSGNLDVDGEIIAKMREQGVGPMKGGDDIQNYNLNNDSLTWVPVA